MNKQLLQQQNLRAVTKELFLKPYEALTAVMAKNNYKKLQ